MRPNRQLPPTAIAITITWVVCAVVVGWFPELLRPEDGAPWLAVGALVVALAALVLALAGRIRAEVRDRLTDRLVPGLPLVLVLLAAAGGVVPGSVGALAVVALAVGARRGVRWGAAAAIGLLVALAVLDLRLGRALSADTLVAAAAILLAGGVLPVWHGTRQGAAESEARRRLERVEGYVARRRTPERAAAVDLSPDGAVLADHADRLLRLRSFDQYLRDVRDRTGADEVLFWRADEEGAEPRVSATSTEGRDEPAYFDAERWGPLLRWTLEAGMAHADHDGEVVRFVTAPAVLDGRQYGALSLSSRAGLTLSHGGAIEWAGRYARHVALLVQLFDIRREHSRERRRGQSLVRVAEAIHRGGSTEGVARRICETAIELAGAQRAALVQWDERLEQGSVRAVSTGHTLAERFRVTADSLVGAQCLARMRLHKPDARPLARSRATIYGPGESLRPIGSLAVLPLERDRMVVGALVVEGDRPESVSSGEVKQLVLLATIAAGSLELFEQIDEASRSARTDALTGLANRRKFDEELRRAFADVARRADETSLVIADVDHFKRVNDSFGHEAGDAVLRHVARICSERVRPLDVCARFGGEEIVILCPRTGLDGARQLAERLREAIAGTPLRLGAVDIAVTASFGVASHPTSVRDSDALVGAADEALYAAKREGRNKVRVYGPNADAATA